MARSQPLVMPLVMLLVGIPFAACSPRAGESHGRDRSNVAEGQPSEHCSLRRKEARSLAGAGKHRDALQAYSTIFRDCSSGHADGPREVLGWPADDLYALALSTFHVQGLDAANLLLKQACTSDVGFCIEASRLCRSAGRFLEARDILTTALLQSVVDFRIWLALGLLFTSSSSYQLALRTFMTAHRLDTSDFKSLVNAAQTESNLGLKTKAAQRLAFIHRKHPNNKEVLLLLVEHYMVVPSRLACCMPELC